MLRSGPLPSQMALKVLEPICMMLRGVTSSQRIASKFLGSKCFQFCGFERSYSRIGNPLTVAVLMQVDFPNPGGPYIRGIPASIVDRWGLMKVHLWPKMSSCSHTRLARSGSNVSTIRWLILSISRLRPTISWGCSLAMSSTAVPSRRAWPIARLAPWVLKRAALRWISPMSASV